MRVSKKRQVLTSGIVDRNGNQIDPQIIVWDEYDENPVLLYDKRNEGHGGVVVGQVINRKLMNGAWVGTLAFMERYEDADIAYEKYEQGVLPYVSIGGFAAGKEVNGRFVMAAYYPREHSLVKFPANREARAIDASTLDKEETKIVNNLSVNGDEIRYVTMSADVTFKEMTKEEQAAHDAKIKRYVQAGKEVQPREAVEAVEAQPAIEAREAIEAQEAVEARPAVEAVEARPAVEAVEGITEVEAAEINGRINKDEKYIEASTTDEKILRYVAAGAVVEPREAVQAQPAVEAVEAQEAVEARPAIEAQEAVEAQPAVEAVEAVEGITEAEAQEINAQLKNPLPHNMTWHEQSNNNQKQFDTMKNKTFKELNCDADFQKRMIALSAALASGAGKTAGTPENAQTLQILATSMLQEKDVVILASVTNYTDSVSQRRSNALEVLIEAAAGDATAATLAAADLGVIAYLSLFYEKLLANDTFRRSLRLVPMSDKAGAIYIEDAVAAPTYLGNNTPIAVPVYTYEDIKRTIARRVFAFNPILFQHSELAILNYDKQSLGLKSTMNQLMQDISTYWLQIIANTPGISIVKTTGSAVPSSGLFPIEAPNSDVNIKKPTLEDLITLEGKFLMQNFNFGEDGRTVECVLPANMYGMLASDPEVRDKLTRELNANIASNINFSATRVTPRNPVARYLDTTDAFQLDPAMYADYNTANDGTFTAIVPAVTVAANIGAGIAFVAQEVLAGIGSIELIVAPSPSNYGTVISGWVSTAATVARQNGVGAAGLVPDVSEVG